jgi:hypothetical protein
MNTPDIKVEKVERVVDEADWNNDYRHCPHYGRSRFGSNREGGEDSNGFKKKE